MILHNVSPGSEGTCEIISLWGHFHIFTVQFSLEKLPFDDEEFDLIVVHSIGLGVPEDEVKRL